MDMKEVAKDVAIEVGKFALTASIGFACGCFAGRSAGPVGILIAGGVYAATSVALRALFLLVESIAIKYEWKLSSYLWTTVLIGMTLQTAAAVTLFALGIIDVSGVVSWIGADLISWGALSALFYVNTRISNQTFDTPYAEVVEQQKEAIERLFKNLAINVDHEIIKAKRWFNNAVGLA